MSPASTGISAGKGDAADEEDDYMAMVIPEPTKDKETSIQRRVRKEKEAEAKSRVKSKSDREADEAAARETALATSIDSSNKGFKLMAKLGYKSGQTLGKTAGARTEPISLNLKEDRGGIGLDAEKKRKIREEAEGEVKRVKAEEGDYRERMRLEREKRRREGQIIGAQKVAEKLDTEAEEAEGTGPRADGDADDDGQPKAAASTAHKPLRSVNVLWRGLIRHRLEKERERRMRRDLEQSLSRLPTYEDTEQDEDDKLALGSQANDAIFEEEVEEDDAELEEFDALDSSQKLERLVEYLRSEHHYCFWCKFQYADASMDGCPGTTEDDHD